VAVIDHDTLLAWAQELTTFVNAADPVAIGHAMEKERIAAGREMNIQPLPFRRQPPNGYTRLHTSAHWFLAQLADDAAPGPLRNWPEELLLEGSDELSSDLPHVNVAAVFEFGEDNVLRLTHPHMDSLSRLFGVTAAELLHPDATVRVRRCRRDGCGKFFVVDFENGRRGARPKYCSAAHALSPLERLRKFRAENES